MRSNTEDYIVRDFINDMAEINLANGRDQWVDYARGIGIILVVYGHVLGGFLMSNPGVEYPLLSFTLTAIYSFHMPLFFFLAGLFAKNSLLKRGTKQFLIDKIKKIVYPYLLWSFLQGEMEVLFSTYIAASVSQLDILTILYHPRAQFWFLYSIFLMFLLYAIISRLKKYSSATILILSIILYFFPLESAFMGIQHFSMSLIFFTCGIFYRSMSIDDAVTGKSSLSYVLILLFLLCMLEAVRFLLYGDSAYFLSLPIFLVYAAAMLLAMIGILSVIMSSKYLAAKNLFGIFMRAGFYSMPIYLAHGIFGSGTRVILNKFFGIQNPAIVIFTGTICGIFIPVFLYKASVKSKFYWLFTLDKAKK